MARTQTVTDMLPVNMGRIGEDLGQVGPLEPSLVIGRNKKLARLADYYSLKCRLLFLVLVIRSKI